MFDLKRFYAPLLDQNGSFQPKWKGRDYLLIVFIRAILLYILIIFSLRLMGKRQLGELQPSELVITILISNIASLPIEEMCIRDRAGTSPSGSPT